jgi:hypothetical protein
MTVKARSIVQQVLSSIMELIKFSLKFKSESYGVRNNICKALISTKNSDSGSLHLH